MNFLIRILLVVAIVMILEFTAVFVSKLADKETNKRIKKLKQANKSLIEQNKRFHNDYQSIYGNMLRVNHLKSELEKENEELKKALDKKENVTYNYYINN